MEKKNVNKVEISQEYGKESIRLAINQISIQNCDGSVNEKAIKAVGLLQEIDIEDYANKRVIEELEKQLENYFNQEVETYLSDNLKNRIKELKQE